MIRASLCSCQHKSALATKTNTAGAMVLISNCPPNPHRKRLGEQQSHRNTTRSFAGGQKSGETSHGKRRVHPTMDRHV